MGDLLVNTYRFFGKRKGLLLFTFLLLCSVIAFFASKISFEEDISRTFTGNPEKERLGQVASNLKFADRLVLYVTKTHPDTVPDPDRLIREGRKLVDSLTLFQPAELIRGVSFQADDSAMNSVMDLVFDYLPLFLDDEDYSRIDSMLTPGAMEEAMQRNRRILSSPAGIVLKNKITRDPIGLTNPAFEKLRSLNTDGSYQIYDGCVFSKDLTHLLIFITPANPSSETSRNDALIERLDQLINGFKTESKGEITIRYFGGAAVAVANARQIKTDILLTLSVAFLLIFLLVGWYFRSLLIPFQGLLPAFFGGGFALAVLYLARGSISAISLGIGSVILGLIVDYSLYLVNHFRLKRDVAAALRDMWLSILLCSMTSAGAFLCLLFLDSALLRDLGWFAALSVAGAAFFTLVFLPHILRNTGHETTRANTNFIDRIARYPWDRNVLPLAILVALVVVSLFFFRKADFEKSMSSLNFVPPDLAMAENELDRIGGYKQKSMFLVATGKSAEEALRNREQLASRVEMLREKGIIKHVSGPGPFLVSAARQEQQLLRWKEFWTPQRTAHLNDRFPAIAQKAGFRPRVFGSFLDLPTRTFEHLRMEDPRLRSFAPVSDWLVQLPGLALAPVILKVDDEDRQQVYREIPDSRHQVLFDRQMLTEKMVEGVKSDFDRLVTLSMLLVTLLLIVSFGRLGLGLMASLPMFASWLITLGFMGMTGIKFNIFNIIVSSFIFGLGVDYSILMMRGLQQQLKTGTNEMATYRVSVLLSALTTLFGVGALLLAKHPALSSIAWISVIGITLVVFVTFAGVPRIFNYFILDRTVQGKFPITLRIAIKTFVTWGNIVLIAGVLMISGVMIRFFFPAGKERKMLLFHKLFCRLSDAYISFTFGADRKLDNPTGEDFNRPAVIISNHQSLIETPAFLMFHPKILILTSDWVYKSPVFGPIARLAGFYNVADGIDQIAEKLKVHFRAGYSILIFPEGHRSSDQHIQRFHRGAFYLAEKLETDLLPVLVFGSGDFLGKGNFWGRPNSLHMKILPRSGPDDTTFGDTYQERARRFRRYMTGQYACYKAETADAYYYRRLLCLNYTLKGPILEWYMKVKLNLENDYDQYTRLMPRQGTIMDLGCGYGFLSYMLMFTSHERSVTGIDHDQEKINLASNCFSRNERIRFMQGDVTEVGISPHSGFVLSDILHYLEPFQQDKLLHACCKNLLPGGVILVREADAARRKTHGRSRVTEFFSTRSGFNKTMNPGGELYFTSRSRISQIAEEAGLEFEIVMAKKRTSNTLFIIRNRHIV